MQVQNNNFDQKYNGHTEHFPRIVSDECYKKRWRFYEWREYRRRDGGPQWLVENIIPRRYVTVLYGDGGSGKSYLALHLARTISAGEFVWLGEAVIQRTKKVAYVDFEMDVSMFGYRTLTIDEDDSAWEDVEYFNGNNYRDKSLDWELLEDNLRDVGADLVIVDSFGFMHAGSHTEAEDVMSTLVKLSVLAQKLDCAVLLIDHIAKDAPTESKHPKPYGSVYKYNAVRSALYVAKNEDSLTVERTKTNFSRGQHWVRHLTMDNEGNKVVFNEEVSEGHGLAYQIIEAIRMLGGKANLKQIEDELKKEFEVEVCRNTIAAYCRKLNLPSEGGGKKGRAYGLTFYLPSTFTSGEGRQ
ncbi:MAG: AAA family ATPase [Chlorobi bacterium]|nr:AAA family ATPase [Chlorobiota bacterium]